MEKTGSSPGKGVNALLQNMGVKEIWGLQLADIPL